MMMCRRWCIRDGCVNVMVMMEKDSIGRWDQVIYIPECEQLRQEAAVRTE